MTHFTTNPITLLSATADKNVSGNNNGYCICESLGCNQKAR